MSDAALESGFAGPASWLPGRCRAAPGVALSGAGGDDEDALDEEDEFEDEDDLDEDEDEEFDEDEDDLDDEEDLDDLDEEESED